MLPRNDEQILNVEAKLRLGRAQRNFSKSGNFSEQGRSLLPSMLGQGLLSRNKNMQVFHSGTHDVPVRFLDFVWRRCTRIWNETVDNCYLDANGLAQLTGHSACLGVQKYILRHKEKEGGERATEILKCIQESSNL